MTVTIQQPTDLMRLAGSFSRDELEELLVWTVLSNPYIPHAPTPAQLKFLLDFRLEIFYGGAAGGGKSDALLMGALQLVETPGYHALILQKTYSDLSLPEALMNRADEWLRGTEARWHDREKTWLFPSTATLTFGYLEYEQQMFRYKGPAFHYIAWDELTRFTQRPYQYLFSRLRRKAAGPYRIPLRVRSGSNPGDIGHDWVERDFVEAETRKLGARFIPAKLKDNPHLDQAEYRKSLEHLDSVTRQQLLDGDWSVRLEGGLFKRGWFGDPMQEAPADLVRRVRFWDLAATVPRAGTDPDYTAGVLLGSGANGAYFVLDVLRFQETPGETEKLISQTASLDGIGVRIRMEQEPGASGVNTIDNYRRKVLPQYDFKGIRSTGSKPERARAVSSQAEAGNIRLVSRSWNRAFLDELSLFPNGGHDDQVDALSGAFHQVAGAPEILIGRA